MPVVAFVRSIPDHLFVMCPGDALALGRHCGALDPCVVSDRIDRDLSVAGDHLVCRILDHHRLCRGHDRCPGHRFCVL